MGPMETETLFILLFTLKGMRFGVDMEGICGMEPLSETTEREIPIGWFHDVLAPEISRSDYRLPMVLYFQNAKSRFGVIIESPEAVNRQIDLENIRPLPKLMEGMCRSSPIWGVALTPGRGQEGIVLLTDLLRWRDLLLKIESKKATVASPAVS